MAAKRFPLDDDSALEDLASLLLRAHKELREGAPGLDWNLLIDQGGTPALEGQTWGEIRRLVLADIEPGGPKARDRNPFVCFRDAGHFGRSFDDGQVAKVEDLEAFALYTPASLSANRADPSVLLIERAYNGKGFFQVVQMVNYLSLKGVAIATPELQVKLQGLKISAGKLQAPKPMYIPRTAEIEEWLDRYRLNDHKHGRAMLAELRSRFPIKTAERADGTVQFINNEALGRVLTRWMKNTGRPDRELPAHLYGYHQPRQLPGKPKERRERCKVYDLRNAWALRARETTTWPTSLKAKAMGHSEAVHARRYLVEERAEHRRQGLLQLVAQAEGHNGTSMAITPEILAVARQLAGMQG